MIFLWLVQVNFMLVVENPIVKKWGLPLIVHRTDYIQASAGRLIRRSRGLIRLSCPTRTEAGVRAH